MVVFNPVWVATLTLLLDWRGVGRVVSVGGDLAGCERGVVSVGLTWQDVNKVSLNLLILGDSLYL